MVLIYRVVFDWCGGEDDERGEDVGEMGFGAGGLFVRSAASHFLFSPSYRLIPDLSIDYYSAERSVSSPSFIR